MFSESTNFSNLTLILFFQGEVVMAAFGSALDYGVVRTADYRPTYLIVDEASQLTEHQIVAVISRYFGRLRKLILVGDEKQRDPFRLDTNSLYHKNNNNHNNSSKFKC